MLTFLLPQYQTISTPEGEPNSKWWDIIFVFLESYSMSYFDIFISNYFFSKYKIDRLPLCCQQASENTKQPI